MERFKPNDFGKFLLCCVIMALLVMVQLRARGDTPTPQDRAHFQATLRAIDAQAPLLPLPAAPRPVHLNVAWGECIGLFTEDPGCIDTCPDGSCVSCYPTLDGFWQCCCPFH